MNKKLGDIVNKLKNSWNSMDMNSLNEVKALVGEFALGGLDKNADYSAKGVELYRDKDLGFILTAYSETNGTYRIPHNHGNGWVIYSVVEGIVEMGNYANWVTSPNQSQLILKNKVNLKSGDAQIYYPGDIHDTECFSDNAIILRLTSCDLKVEETEGRMKRFNSLKD